MKKIFKQFTQFGLVGVSNVLVTYGIYYVLVLVGINYLFANTVGYIIGILNSYYWNNKYVFQNKIQNNVSKLVKVFASYFITYIINIVVLDMLVERVRISRFAAPVIIIIITIPINFLLNKFWAFKER